MLVFAKIFGVVGLVLGMTSYRPLGGVLLVLDGVLLVAAITVALRLMRKERVEEKTQKQILADMVREGTLDQYLRDIHRERAGRAADEPAAGELSGIARATLTTSEAS